MELILMILMEEWVNLNLNSDYSSEGGVDASEIFKVFFGGGGGFGGPESKLNIKIVKFNMGGGGHSHFGGGSSSSRKRGGGGFNPFG